MIAVELMEMIEPNDLSIYDNGIGACEIVVKIKWDPEVAFGCLFEALGINMIDIGYTLVLMGRAGYITKTGLKRLIRKVLKDVAKNVVEVAAWGSVALAYKIGVFMYCYFDKTDSSINFVRNNINLSETNVIGLWNIHLFSQKQIA